MLQTHNILIFDKHTVSKTYEEGMSKMALFQMHRSTIQLVNNMFVKPVY